MRSDDTTTCVYQLIFDEDYSNVTNTILYFIFCGFGLCIKFDDFLAHIFYAWPFINNTAVTIDINNNKYLLSLNIYTNVFTWGGIN